MSLPFKKSGQKSDKILAVDKHITFYGKACSSTMRKCKRTVCMRNFWKPLVQKETQSQKFRNSEQSLAIYKETFNKENLVKNYFPNRKKNGFFQSVMRRVQSLIHFINKTNPTSVVHAPLYSMNDGDLISRNQYETKASDKFQEESFYLSVVFWLYKQWYPVRVSTSSTPELRNYW